jgi:hypothetical protein
MKARNIIAFLILCELCVIADSKGSDNPFIIIKKSDKLIAEKKYETAYKLLEESDPGNGIEEIFLKKVDVALNYYITSMNHVIFTFQDLKPDESVEDLRGAPGDRHAYKLDVYKKLSDYLMREPKNWKLKRVLGCFDFDYFNKFERMKGTGADYSFLEDSKKLLSEAYRNKEYDYLSLQILGYFEYMKQQYAGSVEYLLGSYKLNNGYIHTVYLLAAAYFKSNRDDLAVKYAAEGLKLKSGRNDLKADLAKILSTIYRDRGDVKRADLYDRLSQNYSK